MKSKKSDESPRSTLQETALQDLKRRDILRLIGLTGLSAVVFERGHGATTLALQDTQTIREQLRQEAIGPVPDSRNIKTGFVIPDEGYSDQPYTVITDDGNWLCVLTTGQGVEGQGGQHIVATISSDKGESWSPLIDIEPATGPEASWVMPLKVPSGRVYVFYTYNKGNLRQVPSNSENVGKRVDTLGAYMFKFSDDNGRTWSKERYEIPMRLMRIDRENNTRGKVLFFWGVGKPIIHQESVYFGFAKVGGWGNPGTMITSQGWVEPNKRRKSLIGNRRTSNVAQFSSDFDLPLLAALLVLNFGHG